MIHFKYMIYIHFRNHSYVNENAECLSLINVNDITHFLQLKKKISFALSWKSASKPLWNAWFCPHAHLVPSLSDHKITVTFSGTSILGWPHEQEALSVTQDLNMHTQSPPHLLLPCAIIQRTANGQRRLVVRRGQKTLPHVVESFSFPSRLSLPLLSSMSASSSYGECNLTMPPSQDCLDWSLAVNHGTSLRIWNWPMGHEVQDLWVIKCNSVHTREAEKVGERAKEEREWR